MRNLKKILALALALVMSMSLMATANAFTDDDSITDTYDTAVTVLSELQVFQGYDDGSFLPQGAITRAEVAAIIYRIVTGDVADTQVGIYADYNKFDDVASTSWYAGYVNFCANAEYIKGYDARTFGPNDPVTGYQALAMILRALGYDKNGEFTGTNWQVQTAAVGESRGITKNITAGTLGVPATREVVAEILFQAILVNTVTYMPAFGYREDETSLGWETFGLEYVTGVVTANEYADLYDTEPLDEGETRLDVDGTDYDIAYSTTLEEMGMAYNVYLANGGRVLAIADAGNTVFETGEGTEIDEDNTGMDVDTAQKFLNFDEDTVYTSDWRIEYVLQFEDSATQTAEEIREDFEEDMGLTLSSVMTKAAGAEEYSKVIRPDRDITAADMKLIREIFEIADKEDSNDPDEYVTGEVYVGTSSTDDVSDDHSFRQFMDEYINDEENDANFDESDNGEWLKVIDNDGDGVADYIFLTEFAMSVIDRISNSGEYTLADLANDDTVEFIDVVIDGDEITTEDELAEGDVVIYTLIDGVYYMDLADMVTETVDAGRTAIDSKAETMTCDGTEYEQSHIGYTDDTGYLWDVTDAHTEETYDLYLDHFGYVRLFVESDYNVFMLLTDGWYEDDNRTETFQAYYWDVEADEETLIDVVNDDDNFISNGQRGDEETWGNLWGADVTYGLNAFVRPNTYASNIAGYAETDDGYDLKAVQNSTSRVDYTVQAFDVDVDGLKDTYLEASDPDENDIQTTTNTQYYLVIRSRDNRTASGWNVDDVITWTGYRNAPAEAKLNEDGVVVGYAVTHVTDSDSKAYNVADVVVFETLAYDDHNTYFVYARNNYSNNIEHVWGIGYDEDGAIADQRLAVEATDVNGMIRFYEIYEDEVADEIGEDTPVYSDPKGDYAAHDIYAGYATTDWDIEGVDYIQVNTRVNGLMNAELDAPIYKVTLTDGVYNVGLMDRDDVHYGDAVIIFTDGSSDNVVEYVLYVGDVVAPYDDDDAPLAAMEDLFWDIVDDSIPEDYTATLEAALAAARTALADYAAYVDGTGTKTAAEVLNALEAAEIGLENLTAEDILDTFDETEKAALNNMLGQLRTAIDYMDDIVGAEVDAQEAVDALIAAWNAYQAATGTAKDDALDKLAEELVDYLTLKDEGELTDEQLNEAADYEALAGAAINGYVDPTGGTTKIPTVYDLEALTGTGNYTDIADENTKANTLEKLPNVVDAYDELNPPASENDLTLKETIDAAQAVYDEAKEIADLATALIAAHTSYKLDDNATTEAALLAAYEAIEDIHATGVTNHLFDSSTTPKWEDFRDAVHAAKALVAADNEDALRAKATALVNAKTAYDADQSEANEDALLAALSAISPEENTAIEALSTPIPSYDYNECRNVFASKAWTDRDKVWTALQAKITKTTTVEAVSRADAIAAVEAAAQAVIDELELTADVSIEVDYEYVQWTQVPEGNTSITTGDFEITVSAEYRGISCNDRTYSTPVAVYNPVG